VEENQREKESEEEEIRSKGAEDKSVVKKKVSAQGKKRSRKHSEEEPM
jgi:hypothetical protein